MQLLGIWCFIGNFKFLSPYLDTQDYNTLASINVNNKQSLGDIATYHSLFDVVDEQRGLL
jgi:hypothetical protein